jgi:hypothetical protein
VAVGGVDVVPSSPIEKAIDALENAKPNQANAVKKCMDWIVEQLIAETQKWDEDEEKDELLIQSLASSLPFAKTFGRLTEAVASYGSYEAILACYKGLEGILGKYELPRSFSADKQPRDYDFYKFIGHEYLVMLTSSLMLERKWQYLYDLLEVELYDTSINISRRQPMVSFTRLSIYLESLEKRKNRLKLNRMSIHADLLNERHEGELKDVCSLEDFMAADIFLFFRGEFKKPDSHFMSWKPWSSVYLQEVPSFVWELKNKKYSMLIAQAMGSNVDDLKAEYTSVSSRLDKLWNTGMWDNPLLEINPAEFGSK